jgi:alpha-glucan,water dikinase
MTETLPNGITSQLDNGLQVTQINENGKLALTINLPNPADLVLHWGLSRHAGGAWSRPPESCWPQGTTVANGDAVRTPFAANGAGQKAVTIHLDSSAPWRGLAFVIHSPKDNRWIKSGGKDYVVPLLRARGVAPEDKLAVWATEEDCVRQAIALDSGDRLATAVRETPDGVYVRMVCDAAAPLVLHWGLAWQFQQEWQLPPENCRPAGTSPVDDKAAHTPFAEREGLQYLELQFPRPTEGAGPRGMRFVLLQADDGWLKRDGKDLYLPLFKSAGDARLSSPKLVELAEQIVGAEKGIGSWTLMHRFNLCHDLLGVAQDDEDALALLFAWLRYSAIRQLDWQRRYNTKPRELSHAQDRLTVRLAGIWRRHQPASRCRFWARQMLTTLGRGGEGQRVRDEILHIMHRNHLKEMAGNFIEEWHQKLHNNTTPDDVVICQAYLAFLRSNGDGGTFYRTLEQGGVTRERLRGFERAIKSEPTFYGDRKDALIGEFENFLTILKAVHSGTDLDSAIAAARGRLDAGLNRQLDGLLGLCGRGAAVNVLADAVTSAREGLAGAMAATKDDGALRDLLFLDLALEEFLRGAIERQNVSHLGRDELAGLVQSALRNLHVAVDTAELAVCAGQWAALLGRSREGRDWALHARSVTDRAARWVQDFTSDIYQRLQPKAEVLGAAFGVEAWTVPLFGEEVIRGGPAFTLSLLLRPLDRILRQAAGLGGWQVISPARAAGRVRAVPRLLDVQTERFAESTVLLADRVSGEEEIPEGVTAVLTLDAPDLVSHVAVRARNAGVLFATCFDGDEYQRLKELAGKNQSLHVTPGGDVEYAEMQNAECRMQNEKPQSSHSAFGIRHSAFAGWVIAQDQFASGIVGAKANNLNGLRGRLPDWIHLPKSIALPFGVLDKVLADERNRARRDEYKSLIAATDTDNPSATLASLRALLGEIAAPPELPAALQKCWQRTGLPSIPWEQSWHAVRRVWASKWNDRAFLSRRARGVPHDNLQMAVLIQQVVPADYAFVIHTANPLTGNRDEIFAEVVLGMGETLVGNYPGRALSFVCRKGDLELEVLSYPGKSVGLYGKGVIFRSDSNGEDLEGFAGAGLYDSFLAEEPEHRLLDYRDEKLVWDVKFRDELLRSIARVGVEVERLLGSAQDIEGAVAGGVVHVVQTRPQVGLRDDCLAA